MIALRLFSAADSGRQVDVRILGERDEVTIGRDPSADWPLADPDRALSRLHLTLSVRDNVASVTDTSTNGVTLADREERLPRGEPVRLELGARLEFGPYVLVVERSDAVAAPGVASHELDGPFSSGLDPESDRARAKPDPFASVLAPDPLSLGVGSTGSAEDPFSASGLGGDAWTRRSERRAGDWNPPAPVRDPGAMIGSTSSWTEPPAADKGEEGFGFDAPFTQPLLRTPEVEKSDLAIPSDWDVAPPGLVEPVAVKAQAPVFPALPPLGPLLGSELGLERPEAGPGRDEPPRSDPSIPAAAILPPSTPATTAPDLSEASTPASPPFQSSAALFEAFCAGARLDPAAFALEEQTALMERLGAVYRHMVLGLSDVLSERTALKSEYRMARTTVRAEDNNPFKWAPPQKVAAELLRSSNDGFLDGPEAVRDSFQDVKKHLLCMLAGLRAALTSTLDALAPAHIEEAIKDQPFVLKPRGAVAWAEYARVYGHLRKEAEDNADSPVNREFRAAYEKQLAELDRMALR